MALRDEFIGPYEQAKPRVLPNMGADVKAWKDEVAAQDAAAKAAGMGRAQAPNLNPSRFAQAEQAVGQGLNGLRDTAENVRRGYADRFGHGGRYERAVRGPLGTVARVGGAAVGALNLAGTAGDLNQFEEDIREGNTPGAVLSGLKSAADLGMMSPVGGPALRSVAGAARAGLATGELIHDGLNTFNAGRDLNQWIGKGMAKVFGGGTAADDLISKYGLDEAMRMQAAGQGVPLTGQARPSQSAPAATPAVQTGLTQQNEADMAAGRVALASQPQAQQTGNVLREGNSFSGTNVSGPVSYTGGPWRNNGPVNVMPAGAAGPSGTLSMSNPVHDAQMAALDRGESLGGSWGGGGGGFVRGSQWQRDLDKRNAETTQQSQLSDAMKLAHSRGGGINPAVLSAVMHPGQVAADRDAQLQIAGMREAGENSRAMSRNALEAAMGGLNRDVAMRGQDLTLAGHRMSNDVARAQMQRQQSNWEAEHGLKLQEAGQSMREKGDAALQSRIEAIAPRSKDDPNKPDGAWTASMRGDLNRAMAAAGIDGAHQLSPAASEKLIVASMMLQRMRANSGALPWKPDQLQTINPLDLTNLKRNPDGSATIMRNGKAGGQTIPARFFETEEASLLGALGGLNGTPTNRYDILFGSYK